MKPLINVGKNGLHDHWDSLAELKDWLFEGAGLWENVRKDPKSTTEPAVKFLVLASAEDLNLRNHLNHQVRITGLPDGKVAPPTTSKVEEKDLPRLSAKSVTMVADTCSVPAR